MNALAIPRLWAIGIMLGTALSTPPLAPAEAAGISLETAGRRLDLQGVPLFMAGMRNERFVLGFGDGDATQLSVVDLETDPSTEVARLRLSFSIADGQIDFSGRRLVAVGNKDGKTWIACVELVPEGRIVERPLPLTLAHPLVAVDAAGIAKLADAGLGRIFTLNRSLFDDDASDVGVSTTQFFDSAGGIGSLHVSADGQFGFVGDRASTRLSILDASGRVRDTLSGPTASNPGHVAGPATISFHDGSQGVSAPVSLLMADYASETLRIVDFEPVLQVLSVTASASVALPIKPGSILATGPAGSAPVSAILLGASADEGTIAVGNLFSTTVLFFSRTGSVLSRIGSATTARLPGRLLVSKAGKTVIVSYPDEPFVTAVRLGEPETSVHESARLDPGGSREVREIQKVLDKLGYPIGVVDGYAGPRTMQSLDAFRDRTGREIDLAKPVEALETLRSLQIPR